MTVVQRLLALLAVVLACAQLQTAFASARSEGEWAAPSLAAEEADVADAEDAVAELNADADADDAEAEAEADADVAEGAAQDEAEADADAAAEEADAGADVRFAAVYAGVEAVSDAVAEAAAETEADAEAEAEVEAEAEAEAAAEAEAEMGTRTASRAALRAMTEAATGQFAEASRWMGWAKADAAHAQLTKAALGTVTEVDGADTVARVFDEKALKAGVQWNDQPCGSDKHPADEPLERDAFRREYAYHGAHAALVHNVHFGCLQHFRSQCPSVQRPDLQNEYGDDRYVFSNSDVRDIIIAQLRYWWKLAVEQQQQSGGPTKRAPKPTGKAAAAAAAAADGERVAPMPSPLTPSHDANFALGHILGTVQDAWTQSHVLRSVEDAPTPGGSDIDSEDKAHALAEQCGRVHYFQSGDAQEGNPQKPLESATASAMFFTCAQYYSYVVLRAFLRCATSGADAADQQRWCTFESAVEPVLHDSVYAIAGDHELKPAGGSVERFASPRIERLGYAKTQYDVPGVGAVGVYEPTSTKLWRNVGADDLTVSLCHSVVGKVRNFNGVTYRDERFTDFHAVTRGQRQLQEVTCGVDHRKRIGTGPYYVVDHSGVCETHGWRLSSGCSSHRSCRPAKGAGGCKGRCLCGTKGGCRCVRRVDNAKERCRPGAVEMS